MRKLRTGVHSPSTPASSRGGLHHVGGTGPHALAAFDAAGQKGCLFQGSRRAHPARVPGGLGMPPQPQEGGGGDSGYQCGGYVAPVRSGCPPAFSFSKLPVKRTRSWRQWSRQLKQSRHSASTVRVAGAQAPSQWVSHCRQSRHPSPSRRMRQRAQREHHPSRAPSGQTKRQ
jgi:hypothetical protein